MQTKTRYFVSLAILSAMAFLTMAFIRIPVVLFLKYEPKDVIIVVGGLIFGPMAAFLISLVVSFVEMITVSDTAWIGFVMNVLSTCCFACTASYIYKKNRTLMGAVAGLVCGAALTVAVMMLWNYALTPVFMNMPRSAVVPLLLPSILPFNLLKVGLNSAIVMLIYKPIVNALRNAGYLPSSADPTVPEAKNRAGVLIVAGLVLVTCVLSVMAFRGII